MHGTQVAHWDFSPTSNRGVSDETCIWIAASPVVSDADCVRRRRERSRWNSRGRTRDGDSNPDDHGRGRASRRRRNGYCGCTCDCDGNGDGHRDSCSSPRCEPGAVAAKMHRSPRSQSSGTVRCPVPEGVKRYDIWGIHEGSWRQNVLNLTIPRNGGSESAATCFGVPL